VSIECTKMARSAMFKSSDFHPGKQSAISLYQQFSISKAVIEISLISS